MSFYTLPQLTTSNKLSTDFRPNIPVCNNSKDIFALFQERFVLIIIDNQKLTFCKRLKLDGCTPHRTHTALLFYNLVEKNLEEKLTQYTTVDFCQDYLDTFEKELLVHGDLNCFSNGNDNRVVEFYNPIELKDATKDDIKIITKVLKSAQATSFTQVFVGLTLALLADKRNFPYSYIWTMIDPYHPDWKYWSELFTSFGFDNPELVISTPTGNALNTEMIQLSRKNNYTGKADQTDQARIHHYRQAILKCLNVQTSIIAIKWNNLGHKLRDLVTEKRNLIGGLFFATNKDHGQRALRIGDITAKLLMWPLALKFTTTSNCSINGFGLPIYILSSPFIISEHLAICTDLAVNGMTAMVFATEYGLYLLQCTTDYKNILQQIYNQPRYEPIFNDIKETLSNLTDLSVDKIRNIRIGTLYSSDSQQNKELLELQFCSNTTTLFRIGHCDWDTFSQNGIVFSYLFGQPGKALEYNWEKLV